MKVLFLDYEYAEPPGDFATFSSDQSCFDYDAVIWDPAHALGQYPRSYPHEYRGLPNLDEGGSVKVLSDLARRRTEFDELLKSGRTLVVFVRPDQACYYDTGGRSYSGTGRNRRTTINVEKASIWSALPVPVSLSTASGQSVEFVGPSALATFWAETGDVLHYEAVMREPVGEPAFKIKSTDRLIGSLLRTDSGGALLMLPPPDFDDDFDYEDHDDGNESEAPEDQGEADRAQLFQEQLFRLLETLQHDGRTEPLPDWAQRYLVQGEQDLQSRVVTDQRTVEEARARLTESQSARDQLEARKHLFAGTGRSLELAVRRVFEVLGCEVSEPEPGRDDWILKLPTGPAVVEVKGVNGSAAEKHAAQLEKWVSNYFAEHGVQPKGILVVNAWRTKRLEDRTEPAFPDQMLKYSRARNHCLITGVQLLAILQDVEARPERAADWTKKLSDTKGTLAGSGDWTTVVSITAEDVTEKSAE